MVSIIVPIYNAEKYISETIACLLKQTYQDYEILCVDDGSTDGTREIIRQFAKQSRKIKYYCQPHKNAGAARNYGLERARGDYVIFLDADDLFKNDMLEQMVNKIDETLSDFVICGSIGRNEKNGDIYEINRFKPIDNLFVGDLNTTIFQYSITWAWDKLYRMDFIKTKKLRFQETPVINDLLFVCLSYVESQKISVISQQLICHRSNIDTSLYGKGVTEWKTFFDVFDALKNELEIRNKYNLFLQSYINLYADNLVGYLLLRIKETKVFDALFYYIKRKRICNMLLAYPESYFFDGFTYKIIHEVYNKEKEEFLLSCIYDMGMYLKEKDGIISKKMWKLPMDINSHCGTNIALCGDEDVMADYESQLKLLHGPNKVICIKDNEILDSILLDINTFIIITRSKEKNVIIRKKITSQKIKGMDIVTINPLDNPIEWVEESIEKNGEIRI